MNGKILTDFLVQNDLYACNTFFKHKLAHVTTHVSNLKIPSRRNPIRKQIDFIIAHKNWKSCGKNARSYSGTLTTSDHRLVIASFDKINFSRIHKEDNRNKNIQVDHIKNFHVEYQEYITENKERIVRTTNQEHWSSISTLLIEASEKFKPKKTKNHKTDNEEIKTLSEQQKELRLQIESVENEDQKQKLKTIRNSVLHSIKRIQQEEKLQHITNIVEEINNSKDDSRRMFRAVKETNRKKSNNIIVKNKKGEYITRNKAKIEEISEHFRDVFQSGNIIPCPDVTPTKLNIPFTTKEVKKAIDSLKNNKSGGCDSIRAEHLKNAPNFIIEEITNLLNNIATNGEYPQEIKLGLLTPIQKPGKPKGPVGNLRPVILLSILRKILAVCVIRRISDRVHEHIVPNTQAAYTAGRSTTELVFSFKLLCEKAITSSNYDLHILMLDMSKAFDTIQRGIIFEDLKDILENDELHLIHLLLDNVKIAVKLENEIGEKFDSLIGSPQGDAASALFFIIYLAKTLRIANEELYNKQEVLPKHLSDHDYEHYGKVLFSLDQQYADDISYASTNSEILNNIERTVPKVLESRNLFVNESKTEKYTVSRNSNDDWKNCKLVGSKLHTEHDIKNRKILANVTFNGLKDIFKDKNCDRDRKIDIFCALIESIFLYNSEIWTLTKELETDIDIFQRRLLRNVLNYRYTPDKKQWPSTEELYKTAKQKPWSEKISKRRLSFFGHVCRLPCDTPARKALEEALRPVKRPKGRPKTTYLQQIEKQLKTLGFKNIKQAIVKAKDRQGWAEITSGPSNCMR